MFSTCLVHKLAAIVLARETRTNCATPHQTICLWTIMYLCSSCISQDLVHHIIRLPNEAPGLVMSYRSRLEVSWKTSHCLLCNQLDYMPLAIVKDCEEQFITCHNMCPLSFRFDLYFPHRNKTYWRKVLFWESHLLQPTIYRPRILPCWVQTLLDIFCKHLARIPYCCVL